MVAGSGVALAETGEYGEITHKVEMLGMPMAMPESTFKVCLAQGAERDPRQSMIDPNSKCEMTDVKARGNSVTWKVHCMQEGEALAGTGDVTSSPEAYQGVMRLKGKSGGMNIDMKQNFRGKKSAEVVLCSSRDRKYAGD